MRQVIAGNKIIVTILGAAIIFMMIHLHLYDQKKENVTDGGENIVGAYTIAKYNTYSINLDPHPASKREPFYPFLMGMVIKARNLVFHHANDFREQSIEKINRLKIINMVILFSTSVLAFWFIKRYTKKYWLAVYALFSLIFSAALAENAHSFFTEVIGGFFILAVGLLLFYYPDNIRDRRFYAWLGLAVSLLTLTKAIYLYLIPIVCVYMVAVHYIKNMALNKSFFKNMLVFITCVAVLVGGWMMRNHHYFGKYFVAGRKAENMLIRAEYDKVTKKEYPYLYAVYMPGLSKYFLHEEDKPNWTRLINTLGNDQILLDTYWVRMAYYFKGKTVNPSGTYDEADYDKVEAIAKREILSNPVAHLKLTLAFLYRSIFIEDGAGLEYLGIKLPHENNFDRRVDSVFLAIAVNAPVWLSFFYVVFGSIRRRNGALIGLILIPSFTVLIYSVAAFSHPRYMMPLIPIMTVIFCVGLHLFLDRNTNSGKSDLSA